MVRRLECLRGVSDLTGLELAVEIGGGDRFRWAATHLDEVLAHRADYDSRG